LNCVSCNEPMIVLELDQVEIDYCLDCHGIWLDSGELEVLLDDPSRVKQLLEHPATIKNAQPTKRKCPICVKKMEEITIGDNPPVLIDRCKNDHGLWFDQGELKDIIKLLDSEQSERVVKLLKDMFSK
jgi:Zn-finger nucleic acid-binding protein